MKSSPNFQDLTEAEMRSVYKEADIYQFDILSEKLFGIKELSKHIDKIKEILKNNVISSRLSKK